MVQRKDSTDLSGILCIIQATIYGAAVVYVESASSLRRRRGSGIDAR